MNRRTPAKALLSTYPRSRPLLTPAQQATYVQHYRANRAGDRGLSKIVSKLESWMHRSVARNLGQGLLLEIGAGNLNHATYLAPEDVCDAVEPFRELWTGSPHRGRLRFVYTDFAEIPLSMRYDGILSIAVLEHLTDLPGILARSGLLLREGGSFCAGFPCEGGLLWGLSWRVTTGIAYRIKWGLNYGAIMRHEHVNTADEIILLLRHFYKKVHITRFPLPSRHLSFYVNAVACEPHLDRCRSFFDERVATGTLNHA